MTTTTQETPHFHTLPDESVEFANGKGSELHSTYFELSVTYPALVGYGVVEMSDSELLVAAERAGTFEFLNAPEEDGYNDLIPPRE